MRYGAPFCVITLLLVAWPSPAQDKEAEAKAKRIAAIQARIQSLQIEISELQAERRNSDPIVRQESFLEKKIQRLQIELALLRADLRELQPVEPIKTGVSVHVTLTVTPVRGRMIPELHPYGAGATIRVLDAMGKKMVAEGKTDERSRAVVAVPPGKYVVEVLPRLGASPVNSVEVTVEKERVTPVSITVPSVRIRRTL